MSNEQNTLPPAHIEDGEEVEVVAWQHPQYPERLMTADHKAYNESRDGAPATVAKPYTLALMTVAQHQRIVAAHRSERAALMDTFVALCDYLGIDPQQARKLPGKPSEVFIAAIEARAALSTPPAAVPAELTNVRCMCGDEYPHDSYGAGFIAGSGMCENCDAAIPAKEPPAAGVPDAAAWETRCTTERRFSINQCSAEERASNWREQGRAGVEVRALVYAAPAPPAAGVPEGVSIERDMTGTMHVKVGDFDYVQVRYQHPYTDNASTRQLAERIAALIAAPTPPASEQRPRECKCVYATAKNTAAVRNGSEMGGYLKSECEACQQRRQGPPASEQQRAVVLPEGKLLVSAEPLRKVLFALLGAPHHIRELQATRTPTDLFADNPINVLIAELNAAQGGDA